MNADFEREIKMNLNRVLKKITHHLSLFSGIFSLVKKTPSTHSILTAAITAIFTLTTLNSCGSSNSKIDSSHLNKYIEKPNPSSTMEKVTGGTLYSLVATISGLTTGNSFVLSNNGSVLPPISSNGPVTLASQLTSGTSYALIITSQPNGLTCTINNNSSGTIINSSMTNISISCIPATYKISATISGLSSSGSLTLSNNDVKLTAISASNIPPSGQALLASKIGTGSKYNITIANQPNGSNCLVSNSSGVVTNSDITNVSVACVAVNYNITGYILGLNSGALTLSNNGYNLPVFNPSNLSPNGQFSIASN
jgi:hypothetical protein